MSTLSHHLARFTGLRRRHELDEGLALILRDLLHLQSVGVYRPVGDPDDLRWSACAWYGDEPSSGPALASLESTADTSCLPVLDAHPLRRRALGGEGQFQSGEDGHLTVMPLHSASEVVGVVECCTRRALPGPQADVLADVLDVYRNVHGLLDYSERDTLTGLLNRKTFDASYFAQPARGEELPAGLELRSAPRLRNTWVGVIDVDRFKSINDRFGHLIGDEVLILLARLMRAVFRRTDGLYRFGGEEFVALVRNASASEALKVFERFRRATAAFSFPQVGRLTVSVGFAEARGGESPSDVIGRADEAVYFAKAHGRNQVHDYAALIARGALEARANVGEVEFF